MTLLQFAIGTVNDLVDAPSDAGRKAGKPIPDGLVSPRAARVVAGASAAAGLVARDRRRVRRSCCSPLVVLGIGLAYDLAAKGTTLSWLPFAVGIPLLPVFGWYGATGTPARAVPDARPGRRQRRQRPRDRATPRSTSSGTSTPATGPSPSRSGPTRASALVLVLHAVVAVLAVSTAAVLGAPDRLGGGRPARHARAARRGGARDRGRGARGVRASGSSPGRSRRWGRGCSRSPGWPRSAPRRAGRTPDRDRVAAPAGGASGHWAQRPGVPMGGTYA